MRRRLAILAAGTLVLVVPGVASAAEPPRATPQQIYKDIIDNGRLDRPYRYADVERALRGSTRQGYRRPEMNERDTDTSRAAVAGEDVTVAEFPFSKLDAALVGGVVALLLLAGALLRLRQPGAERGGGDVTFT